MQCRDKRTQCKRKEVQKKNRHLHKVRTCLPRLLAAQAWWSTAHPSELLFVHLHQPKKPAVQDNSVMRFEARKIQPQFVFERSIMPQKTSFQDGRELKARRHSHDSASHKSCWCQTQEGGLKPVKLGVCPADPPHPLTLVSQRSIQRHIYFFLA